MKRFFKFIEDILLRYYLEIIAGFWDVFIIIPIDSALYKFFTGVPSYKITTTYWIFFGFYTTFFLISSALIPIIKIHRLEKTLSRLVVSEQITTFQKDKILTTLKGIFAYQPIVTRDGLVNFVLENIFALGIMFAWFGIEGIIANTMSGETLVVPMIFNALFLALLILQSFLDEYIAQQVRYKYKKTSFGKLCRASKILAMQIVADIGGGGNSDKMGRLLLDRVVEEIGEIMELSEKE